MLFFFIYIYILKRLWKINLRSRRRKKLAFINLRIIKVINISPRVTNKPIKWKNTRRKHKKKAIKIIS